jgi:hypothetical protein
MTLNSGFAQFLFIQYSGCELTADFLDIPSCPAAIEVCIPWSRHFKPRDSRYALAVWSRSAAGAVVQST